MGREWEEDEDSLCGSPSRTNRIRIVTQQLNGRIQGADKDFRKASGNLMKHSWVPRSSSARLGSNGVVVVIPGKDNQNNLWHPAKWFDLGHKVRGVSEIINPREISFRFVTSKRNWFRDEEFRQEQQQNCKRVYFFFSFPRLVTMKYREI